MNEDIVKGNLKQVAGKIKAKWGKLTNDEIDEAAGNSEILAGKLQEHYGLAKEEAKKHLKDLGCH